MSDVAITPEALGGKVLDVIDADVLGLYEFRWAAQGMGLPDPDSGLLQAALVYVLGVRPDAQVRRAMWLDGSSTEPYEGDPTALPADAWAEAGEDGGFLAIARPPFPEDGLAYDRSRATAVAQGIQRLFEQTSTTDYVREIDGIQGLLVDPSLDDAEALGRALGAFSRMHEQMATSRDEFYLRHPDREQRRKYNTWFAASMERLEAHLRAED